MNEQFRNPWMVPLGMIILSVGAAAGNYDATNGGFGAGSYVGSSHWFASFTQSVLIQAAARGRGQPDPTKFSPPGHTGALKQLRKEDAEKGYFRIDPVTNGTGYQIQADGRYQPPREELWVRPRPDGSWKPPQVGAGYQPPQSDGSWKPPQVGAGYVRPGEAATIRGDEAVQRRDLTRAIREYRTAIEKAAKTAGRGPRPTPARFALGVALLSQQRPAEAARELAIVVQEEPSDLARLMYGTALLCQGDLAGAEGQFSQCSSRATEGLSDLLLGLTRDRQGQRIPALWSYERYLEKTPSPEVHRRLEELRSLTQWEANPPLP